MIFVTVGTHEQPFNRLVQKIDNLIVSGIINEEVYIQRGMESFIPQKCPSSEMLSYQEMCEMVNKARIVVTHGGPGSIMMPLSLGKIPIVVPRQALFGEHVDDHQVDFTRRLDAQKKIIAVYDIELLTNKITDYEEICRKMSSAGTPFVTLMQLIENLGKYCGALEKI